VTHLNFYIQTQNSKAIQELQEIREALNALNMDDRWKYMHERLETYDFSKIQRNKILQDEELANRFVNADMEIQAGKRKPNDSTAYMAVVLGFNESKSKRKKK
jgi:2-phospho-L-lactate transferase/gluconeogenesis factor (CofD/UPF0052 family)